MVIQGLISATLDGTTLSLECDYHANSSTFRQVVGEYISLLKPARTSREFKVRIQDGKAQIYRNGKPLIDAEQTTQKILFQHDKWSEQFASDRCKTFCSQLGIDLHYQEE